MPEPPSAGMDSPRRLVARRRDARQHACGWRGGAPRAKKPGILFSRVQMTVLGPCARTAPGRTVQVRATSRAAWWLHGAIQVSRRGIGEASRKIGDGVARRECAVRMDAGRFPWARSLESVGDGLAIRHKTNCPKKATGVRAEIETPVVRVGREGMDETVAWRRCDFADLDWISAHPIGALHGRHYKRA